MLAMKGWNALEGPILLAHRGACLELPENTLPALRRALELGADVLETDVQVTSDGAIVVSHDPSGERTAGVQRRIGACTLAEVRSWDIGSGLANARMGQPAGSGSEFRIPTLEELLQELPGALFNVDIKPADPAAARLVVELVERQNACERVLLTSFHLSVLRRVRELGYPGPVGMSRVEVACVLSLPSFLLRIQAGARRAQIPLRYGPLRLDGGRVLDRLHALGLAVDWWVVNRPEQAERLLGRGADGIITDDVAAMAGLFRRSPHTAGWRARHPEQGP
jgi:glycerophosphoryl diester phosphodiesterase